MKLSNPKSSCGKVSWLYNFARRSKAPARQPRFRHAFTLAEIMVASATFSLVVIGIISAHLFGMKYDQRIQSKLGASDEARASFTLLTSDIRASKMWRVGTGGFGVKNFTNAPDGKVLMGNALQLNPTTDTNLWIRYYYETNTSDLGPEPNGRLCRYTSSGEFTVVAEYLTNTMTFSNYSCVFHAEDYQGKPVTNYTYKYVIATILEFYQYSFPKTKVGPGNLYDYYSISLKASSHCPS